MLRGRTRVTRASIALVACVLWLGGVELLPVLHEGLHARLAAHRHDGGSIVVASFEDTTHRHPDGSIHFVAPGAAKTSGKRTKRMRDGGAQAADAAARDHAGGLAHRAEAVAPAVAPRTQPLPFVRFATALVQPRRRVWVSIDPLAATARGPPAIASS